jgi:antitoxin HicB
VCGVAPLTAAKVELYRIARASGVIKAGLGRNLGCFSPQVDRLYDIRHASKFEQLDRAFQTMGKHLDIVIEDTAEFTTTRVYRRHP